MTPPPTEKELLQRSQEDAQRLQRRAGRHQEKRDKIERHNRRLGDLLDRRTRDHQNRLGQLAALRREHILELTTHIFSMKEEKQGSRSEPDPESHSQGPDNDQRCNTNTSTNSDPGWADTSIPEPELWYYSWLIFLCHKEILKVNVILKQFSWSYI